MTVFLYMWNTNIVIVCAYICMSIFLGIVIQYSVVDTRSIVCYMWSYAIRIFAGCPRHLGSMGGTFMAETWRCQIQRCRKNWHGFTASKFSHPFSGLWKVLPLDDHGVQWLSTAKQVVDRAVVGIWSRGWGWFPKFDLQLEVRLVWAYPCPTWRFRRDVQTQVNQLLFDCLVVRGYAQEDTANQCHLSFIKLNRRNWRVCFLRVPPILGKKQHVELEILNLWEFLWIRAIRPQVVDFRWEWIFWCKSYR